MDRGNPYFPLVELLVRALPVVARQDCFALKGGSAINLFIRDLPRLSVDIDLVYLSRESRGHALPAIARALDTLEVELKSDIKGASIESTNQAETDSQRLMLRAGSTRIKIELSPVFRGTVWAPEVRPVVPTVEELFGFAEIRVSSHHDLYAGKICAALDRQHPRDLFDVMLLLDNEGLNRDLIQTFLVYLISHRRPIAELLSPRRKDISAAFENEFQNMTTKPVSLQDLLDARERLIQDLQHALTTADREFLLSVKRREPDWALLELSDVEDLPAVQWKLLNLGRMDAGRHRAALDNLEKTLGATSW